MTSNRDLARALNDRSLKMDRAEAPLGADAVVQAKMSDGRKGEELWLAFGLGAVIGWGLGMVSALAFGVLRL